MTCEEAEKNLALLLYGELSFEEEELVEVHVDECAACRKALARERAMFAALDSVELVPSAAALAESRAELRRRLELAAAPSGLAHVRNSGFWDKIREGFTIHFHFAPGLAQVAGAAAMLALGFLTARVTPHSLGGFGSSEVMPLASSRVRYVEPVSPGRVQIVLDETRQRVLSGSVDDEAIQRLLLTAAKDPSDAGLRVGVRVTVQRRNYRRLADFVTLARQHGAAQISFLAADVSNAHAFGRNGSADDQIALTRDDLVAFTATLDALERDRRADFASGFIAESPAKLRRLAQYYAALRGAARFPAPRCNAPEFSAVMDAGGRIQPCFFIQGPAAQDTRLRFDELLNDEPMRHLRADIRSGRRSECERCVCSMWRNLEPVTH